MPTLDSVIHDELAELEADNLLPVIEPAIRTQRFHETVEFDEYWAAQSYVRGYVAGYLAASIGL